MTTFPAPNPKDPRLNEYLIYGLDDDWNATDQGDWTIYTLDPTLVPVGFAPRVIYELRNDIGRLNREVMELVEKLRAQS